MNKKDNDSYQKFLILVLKQAFGMDDKTILEKSKGVDKETYIKIQKILKEENSK